MGVDKGASVALSVHVVARKKQDVWVIDAEMQAEIIEDVVLNGRKSLSAAL